MRGLRWAARCIARTGCGRTEQAGFLRQDCRTACWLAQPATTATEAIACCSLSQRLCVPNSLSRLQSDLWLQLLHHFPVQPVSPVAAGCRAPGVPAGWLQGIGAHPGLLRPPQLLDAMLTAQGRGNVCLPAGMWCPLWPPCLCCRAG